MILIQTNIRIYSYQENDTNEYPNIFVSRKLIRTNVRINIRIENIWIFKYSNIFVTLCISLLLVLWDYKFALVLACKFGLQFGLQNLPANLDSIQCFLLIRNSKRLSWMGASRVGRLVFRVQIPLAWDTCDMQIKTWNRWNGSSKRFLLKDVRIARKLQQNNFSCIFTILWFFVRIRDDIHKKKLV